MKVGISPRDFAAAIGVSESSVKRWVDQGLLQAMRTAGGHRRIPRDEGLRFVREQGVRIARPDILGLDEVALPPQPGGDTLERASAVAYDQLVLGDASGLRSTLTTLYVRGETIARIADEVLRPAFARIGTLWCDGAHGVFLEHRATRICISAIDELRAHLPTRDDGATRGAAITAAPAHDPYFVPTTLVSLVLQECGWDPLSLGPDTPLDVVAVAAGRIGSKLIALSVTSSPTASFRSDLLAFLAAARRAGQLVAIGGQSAAALELAPAPGLYISDSLTALATHLGSDAPRA